ncbi:hypothetical protein ACVU7I_02475 [Patulibacter sp. S7RM1-6]
MASATTTAAPWAAPTTALGRVDAGRVRLAPSLARQRAVGLRVDPCPAPAPAPYVPLPDRVDLPTLMACLEPVVYGRGIRWLDLRSTVHAYALLTLLRRQAAAPNKGRRPRSATARASIRILVERMAPACGWDVDEPTWQKRERHQSSVRRWLALLVDAGVLASSRVVDDLEQDRATDFTLLQAPVPPADAIEAMRRRLARWRTRYGRKLERSPVAGPVLAYLEATRRALDREHRGASGRRRRAKLAAEKRRARGSHNTFGTPPRGLPPSGKGVSLHPSGEEETLKRSRRPTASENARARARETDWEETRLDGIPDSSLAAALSALPGSNSASREEGEAERLAALDAWQTSRLEGDTARWTARIADSEGMCHRHDPTPSQPLPALPALRLAAVGRLVGPEGLAQDPVIPRISDRDARRLTAAARRWLRYGHAYDEHLRRTAGRLALSAGAAEAAAAPSPAAELLRLAAGMRRSARPVFWARLTAAFVERTKHARSLALTHGTDGVRRDQARQRNAQRHRLLAEHYWPEWIARDGDQFVTLGHTRAFVQVHYLPSRDVLESEGLRRWLRAATALMWGVVPSSIEFSDPDGRNAVVPVDLAKARHRGEPVRGIDAWKANRRRRR